MEDEALRLLIITKLNDGRLPRSEMPRVFGGPGNGEMCAACDEKVAKGQTVIEGANVGGKTIYFHPRCFYIWSSERGV